MGFFSSAKHCVASDVKSRLQQVNFLTTKTPFLSVVSINSAILSAKKLHVVISVNIPCLHLQDDISKQLSELLTQTLTFASLNLEMTLAIKRINRSEKISSIKQVVLVASGKGGVGKSTTAANLALALSHGGANVGLLDADIYGPSLPVMLGSDGLKPTSKDGKLLSPLVLHGIEAMSLGFLVDKDDAMVWRGPMASRALSQLIYETRWGDLDYLIVDMPPGTGDIQLTMASDVPVSGAVIVTTPQNLALHDAQKGISMFKKVNVAVLGVIENMSYHVCTQCSHQDHLFGQAGGEQLAQYNHVDLLGHLPLDGDIGRHIDSGTPTMVCAPQSDAALAYLAIAQNVAIKLNESDLSIESMVFSQ